MELSGEVVTGSFFEGVPGLQFASHAALRALQQPLDEDAVYYLRARGVGLEMAHQMLVRAFAGDILDRIKVGPVREDLTDRAMAKFERVRKTGKTP